MGLTFKHDLVPYTVSELSRALRAKIHQTFGTVCVKGEVSQPKRQRNTGHFYFRLKEEENILEAIGWHNVIEQWAILPTEGMQVMCKGTLTTYFPRSQYQMIVEKLDCAGEGTWLKVLADRKRRLSQEGIFDRPKKPLPPFPSVIGLITSPQGVALQDILHRLKERFPIQVVFCPVTVEGRTAVSQITAALKIFNGKLPPNIPRPDLLIIARGGGTLESLMPFNEEIVVRTAASCSIPLITAIGHETDKTLIDYIADLRVATPTAAAEKAVPVRTELLARIRDLELRLVRSLQHLLKQADQNLLYLKHRHLYISSFLHPLRQQLDEATQRYQRGFSLRYVQYSQSLEQTHIRLSLQHPLTKYQSLKTYLCYIQKRLKHFNTHVYQSALTLLKPLSLYNPTTRLTCYLQEQQTYLFFLTKNLEYVIHHLLLYYQQRLKTSSLLIDALEHQHILKRGYVLVSDAHQRIIRKASTLRADHIINLHFSDKTITAVIMNPNPQPLKPKKPQREKKHQLKLL